MKSPPSVLNRRSWPYDPGALMDHRDSRKKHQLHPQRQDAAKAIQRGLHCPSCGRIPIVSGYRPFCPECRRVVQPQEAR